MADEQTYVAMLKDSEKFLFVTLDADRVSIVRATCGLTHDEMDVKLHKMGMPFDEVKSKIDYARKNPV